ncbi:MAG: hypothetical protein IIA11_02695 [Proteobacteria bacterium]|nr:hypothetical protein [Pseudomonadota bacterium]
MFGFEYPVISADTVIKVRLKCNEYQREFAERFGVTKRTVIRWEKSGAQFRRWDQRPWGPWRVLVRHYPRLFTKAEREVIRR